MSVGDQSSIAWVIRVAVVSQSRNKRLVSPWSGKPRNRTSGTAKSRARSAAEASARRNFPQRCRSDRLSVHLRSSARCGQGLLSPSVMYTTRIAARARSAFWRMTLQANASSSGCGAMSSNLERLSNVGATTVENDTSRNKRESKSPGNRIQRQSEVLPPGRSEMAIDGLRPKHHQVMSARGLHKAVSAL